MLKTSTHCLQDPSLPPLPLDSVLHRLPCSINNSTSQNEEEDEEETEANLKQKGAEEETGVLDPLSSASSRGPLKPSRAAENKHVSVCVCVQDDLLSVYVCVLDPLSSASSRGPFHLEGMWTPVTAVSGSRGE